jgi:hypothetical protein
MKKQYSHKSGRDANAQYPRYNVGGEWLTERFDA